ncbi:MAG: GspE/PulE family protein [bacterium]
MTTTGSTRLGNVLRQTGLFTDAQVEDLARSKRPEGQSLTELAVNKGYAKEDTFLDALARALNVQFVRLDNRTIEQAVLDLLPPKVVFQYNVIPLAVENGSLLVATHDPFNAEVFDALRLAAGMRVRVALSPLPDIKRAGKKFYGIGAETVEEMIEDNRIEVDLSETLLKTDLGELDQETSIVKFVNQVIWEAYNESATDIHLEPMEDSLRIRYRIDGILHQTPLPAQLNRFQAAIISRIKVMANMNIAEKRLPQDGRIGMRIKGEDLDIRVSTMPTVYGESVSLRLLMRGKGLITLAELGMADRDAQIIRTLINRPNGIILVTGPTGCGKSTSLYAYLHEINRIDQRILTIEDPIEYEMPGVNQVQLRDEIGLTFASALRSFLRQDPDVLMVGEIRDLETAEIAIRASLTGHLVFSTLHTNDSPGAITRLLDMGVEPFLVASSLRAVVAQRLVRRLCRDCRLPFTPDESVLRGAKLPTIIPAGSTVFEAKGCEKCHMTGYKGRAGIYEVLRVTEELDAVIVAREPTSKIKQKAVSLGMRTLREDGWGKVLGGLTTIDEIISASEEDA